MTDSDPTIPQPPVPPPWPTSRPSDAPPPPPPPGAPGGPGWGAPGWPDPPQHSGSRKGIALLTAVALLFGGLGAAIGVAVANQSDSSTSPSSFVSPGNDNDGQGSFPGDFGSGSSGSGSSGSAAVDIDVRGIARKVSPAIVNIETTLSSGKAAGSGMVISSSGLVVTNNHVIAGAEEVNVEVGVTGKTYSAKVLGYDVEDDVALIKLNDASGMKTISTANASSVSRNDQIVAIGNALGQFGEPAAVGGRVTALHQRVTAGDGTDTETLSDMIRIAASIQPGDSGGALVNDDGKVIGMNTAADAGSGRFGFRAGTTGFAIPIGNALTIVDEIKSGDSSNGAHIGDRALLGVVLDAGTDSPFGSDGSDTGNGSGAAISDVGSDSPADKAGIEGGDMITSVGKHSISSSDELRSVLDQYHPGDKVSIAWVDQDGDSHRATVTLTKGPPA